jgi:photosystem II stability/assembly factor-like uncharacterized protein
MPLTIRARVRTCASLGLAICSAIAVAGQSANPVFSFRVPYNIGGGTASALAVDPQGNSYLAAASYPESSFPITDNAAQKTKTDMFVAKVDRTGDHVIWATYLGGRHDTDGSSRSVANWPTGIAVDPEGNVVVVGGTTTDDFPVVNAVISSVSGPGTFGFLTKISADGSRFVYSTYLGAASPVATATDTAGNAYVALSSTRALPYTTTDLSGPGLLGNAIVAKFNPAGGIVFATRFGGSQTSVTRMVVDNTGQIVVAGGTTTEGLRLVQPIVRNCWSSPNSGSCGNPLVAKLDRDGRSISFATFLGGTTDRSAITSLAVDPTGAVYVAGGTLASDFPTRFPYRPERSGDSDYFLSRIAADNSLETSTYLGSDVSDTFLQATPSVLVDLAGQPTIVAETGSRSGIAAGMQHPDMPLYVSRDDGASWAASATGLRTQVFTVAASERDRTWYAAAMDGVYRSSDGGATWTSTTTGIAAGIGGGPQTYEIVVDQAHAGTVYAGTNSGTYKSEDRGDTWRRIDSVPFGSPGIGDYARLVVDGNGVIFLGSRGLRRSADGGRTWTDHSGPFAVVPPGVNRAIEMIVFDPNIAGTMYALQQNVLFRSINGGDTWTKLPGVRPEGERFLISSFYGISGLLGRPGHLFSSDQLFMIRSDDNGQTWGGLSPRLNNATFRTDPARPDTMFAIDSYRGKPALLSHDGGETWAPIDVPTRGRALFVLDPLRPSTLFVADGIRTLPVAVQFDSTARQVRSAVFLEAPRPSVSAIDPTGALYLLSSNPFSLTKFRSPQP